ncbi:MAG: hypothetical protein U9R19_14200 [Bacteroidota bacterium]|nr:hypothetical protein [Bacteroidota bacterium]
MKTLLSYCVILAGIFNSDFSAAQNVMTNNDSIFNPRLKFNSGLKVNLGGPALFLSLSGNRFVTNKSQIEAGLGVYGLFAGYKHHWNGDEQKNRTVYSGASFVWNLYMLDYHDEGSEEHWLDNNYVLYLPGLGINYIGKRGFSFNAEIALRFGLKYMVRYPLWIGVGIGWQFIKSDLI